MRAFLICPVALATAYGSLQCTAALATSTTCSTSAVCAESVNTYTSGSAASGGVAIHGEANGGIGVRGTSVSNVGFYGASNSGSYLTPGVEGESTNNTGNDAGAGFGLAALATGKAPDYGAFAFGSRAGFAGYTKAAGTATNFSAHGYGVIGVDLVSSASSSGDYNAGVLGGSTYGTAMLAEANGAPTNALFGITPIGVYAVSKEQNSSFAYAFFGESDDVGLGLYDTFDETLTSLNTPGDYASGGSTSGDAYFYIDKSGDEVLSGTLTTAKGTYVRARGTSGAALREYGDRMTAPQVEDVGEGQLANGRAYVAIDARLADTIDRRSAYHVFVTPEGDCKGLFVTQKRPSGFAVRELQGGRSSLAFEYRIVARPADESGTRLAAMPEETHAQNPTFERGPSARRIAAPLSIEDDLNRRLGPQGYAKALTSLRARLIGR